MSNEEWISYMKKEASLTPIEFVHKWGPGIKRELNAIKTLNLCYFRLYNGTLPEKIAQRIFGELLTSYIERLQTFEISFFLTSPISFRASNFGFLNTLARMRCAETKDRWLLLYQNWYYRNLLKLKHFKYCKIKEFDPSSYTEFRNPNILYHKNINQIDISARETNPKDDWRKTKVTNYPGKGITKIESIQATKGREFCYLVIDPRKWYYFGITYKSLEKDTAEVHFAVVPN